MPDLPVSFSLNNTEENTMNALHLQFGNFAYEVFALFDDFFFEMEQLSKVHPVIANVFLAFLGIITTIVLFMFLDFAEEKYVPVVKNVIKGAASKIKESGMNLGKKLQKKGTKMIRKSIYLAVIGIPLLFIGILLRGGIR